MLDWNTDRKVILETIKQSKSLLKIILKTKNDPFFIDDWIDHHSNIVGNENIIIFDNKSTDELLLDKYSTHKNKGILLASFEGFHNNIHDTNKFSDLYSALNDSCDFFLFLDSDERLIAINDGAYYKNNKILDILNENYYNDIIPSTWIYNTFESKKIFKLGTTLQSFQHGLNWGKPIISTKAKIDGFINHNTHVAKNIKNNVCKNFFTLHLANLYKSQRITSNINKLVSRGFISGNESIDEIIHKDKKGINDSNIIMYVNELASMNVNFDKRNISDKLYEGMISLEDGNIAYYSSKEAELLKYYLAKETELTVTQDNTIYCRNNSNKKLTDPEEKYTGYVDSGNNYIIRGWAVNKNREQCKIIIEINKKSEVIAYSTEERGDLKSLNISNGLGGFTIDIKSELSRGVNSISIKFENGEVINNGTFNIIMPSVD